LLTNKRIGVLMGGTSAEREISLKSGAAIYNALKGLGYNAVDIDAGPDICSVLSSEKIEIALLALHGGHGENGSVQGMLEVLGIPYTGSGVLASALAMDKEASKKMFFYHKVPMPPFVVMNSQSLMSRNGDTVKQGLGEKDEAPRIPFFPSSFPSFDFPWVIKPATEGSSVGVSIVRDKTGFEQALEKAYSYGSRIIVEKYIEGKEVHIGILNRRVLGGVEVRPSLEFYDYKAKYTAGLTEYILPPEIDSGAYERAKASALSAHVALGCKGATRVDLRIDKEGSPYVLEVNTIPGMTETSLLPKIAALAGFDFPALIEQIVKGVINEGR
jgi:D-alanine-D-alanine ligase